jgi:8-oxo-dGTP pyrophosphatase MutT (NUDIX family)
MLNSIPDDLITAAGCLAISKDGLVVAFARKSDRTKLGLPCGKREKGETPAQCAIRETEEEVGLKITLKGDEKVFCIVPDDKESSNLKEYCATFIVYLNENHQSIAFAESNLSEQSIPEGEGIWIKPQEFIQSANSAFLNYNTQLLKYAGLID